MAEEDKKEVNDNIDVDTLAKQVTSKLANKVRTQKQDGVMYSAFDIAGKTYYMKKINPTEGFLLAEKLRGLLSQDFNKLSSLKLNDKNISTEAIFALLKINPDAVNCIFEFCYTRLSITTGEANADGTKKVIFWEGNDDLFFTDFTDTYEFLFLFVKLNFMDALVEKISALKAV